MNKERKNHVPDNHEEGVLANLTEALKNGGWDEELLHQVVQKILEKETQK